MKLNYKEIIQNLIVAITVSFAALSLGAAFGILSGRTDGALIGMLSAGIIALVTSIFGGTRLQCSGPTGPMTTLTTTIVQAASIGMISAWGYDNITIANPDHFINIVIILSSILIIICGLFKLGNYIKLVPPSIISGFMDGIAIIIVISQIKKIFGSSDVSAFEGSIYMNMFVALSTLTLIFLIPYLIRSFSSELPRFISGTLASIIIVSFLCNFFDVNIEKISISSDISNFNDIKMIFLNQFPSDWNLLLILAALPFALQLTMLCYLDTLLTSLVIDKMTKEKTNQNKELIAQGTGNGIIAFIGGIPGAQATIRSVLLVKEGATLRLAGIAVGFIVIVEILLFSQWMSMIPQAVFTGVLLKVAYDVFDWEPLTSWVTKKIYKQSKSTYRSSNIDVFFILGTMLVTVFWNLNVAVITFTTLYYILKKFNILGRKGISHD